MASVRDFWGEADAIARSTREQPRSANALKGKNFAVKPYVDDGGPLPSVGDRVVYLPFTGGIHVEGKVKSIDALGRRVEFEGFKFNPHDRTREDLSGWCDAKDVAVVPR